jgi:3',5'-cyclic AMP phosphodiesterase CpdA
LPFTIAHVSDLHVSTFGDTFHDRARVVKRSANPADVRPSAFDVLWEEAGWRVLRPRGKATGKLSIVDPEGFAHPPPGRADVEPSVQDPVERAAAKACRLEARRAGTLAAHVPSAGALELLAAATPKNSNVRLLRAARAVEASQPDAVVLTGDVTDDGDGWELALAAFRPWALRGRLFVVPGNHDRYLFPLGGSGRPRPTVASKLEAWRGVARTLGLDLHPCGAWFAEITEAKAIVVGLDSCVRPQRRFFRHNGAIGAEQIAFLLALSQTERWKDAQHRIVMLHHHVVPLPHGVGRRAPSEIGMRLDDAQAAAEAFDRAGVTLVMHGHRHVSEERQPAGCKFRLVAAPSLTLGCRSGDGPSFWRLELGDAVHATRVPVPLDAIEQDEAEPGDS